MSDEDSSSDEEFVVGHLFDEELVDLFDDEVDTSPANNAPTALALWAWEGPQQCWCSACQVLSQHLASDPR